MLLRTMMVWLLMAVLAIVNGTVRNALITPHLGENAGHVISTVSFCILSFFVMWLLIPWIGPKDRGQVWQIGIIWLGSTIAFEFIAGHYVFGNPWDKLLADYNIFRGRIWIAVLLLQLFGPLGAARLRGL
jgi:hypothetical protein